MEEVKKEKFGSRKSILKDLFKTNCISFISNIWVITCRNRINSDKDTRYLICIEGKISDESVKILLSHIKVSIPIINVCFDEESKKIDLVDLINQKKSILSYEEFKNAIIKRTCCKYIDSYAKGSTESTPLSRFFRENMGKGFALTDIDFFITSKKLFFEEKNFIKNNEGYLGIGQCISMQEIINDIFNDITLKIVCIDNNNFYLSDVQGIDCYNTKVIEGWGKMVVFKLDKVSKEDFIKTLTD